MLRVTIVLMLATLGSCLFDNDLHEKYLTMPHHEFIEYFNKQGYSWKAADYGRDMTRSLGARIDYNAIAQFPIQEVDTSLLKDLPENFDSREKWPNCKTIQEIHDQGNCGSCWTFGTADTASDRTCIHLNISVNLAEQDLQCSQKAPVCKGGWPIKAFQFWHSDGLVSQRCKPYDPTPLHKVNWCPKKCVDPSIDYAKDKHYGEKVYTIESNNDAIKTEIFKNGPIQAGFLVFDDFNHYKTGIYEHKYGGAVGYHSVRVIGYGVQNGTEYWLVANSWGKDFGENGFFKVKKFTEDLEFEKSMCSGIPKN